MPAPLLTLVHFFPPSILLKTPSAAVPAYIGVFPKTNANACTSLSSVGGASRSGRPLQLFPLSTLIKTPRAVPAYKTVVALLIAKARTVRVVKPLLIGVQMEVVGYQLVGGGSRRSTPPSSVPIKITPLESIARALILALNPPTLRPRFKAVQLRAPSL